MHSGTTWAWMSDLREKTLTRELASYVGKSKMKLFPGPIPNDTVQYMICDFVVVDRAANFVVCAQQDTSEVHSRLPLNWPKASLVRCLLDIVGPNR